MAVITPSTDLYLLKVPLEIDDINQLDFTNASAQFNYFNSLPKIGVDDFTYQRRDNTIRFPAVYDDIVTYNYVMYRNDSYSDKWFYAFITNMEYVNDNMTMITIKSDVWQCWQFDLYFKPCLIDREHTNNDGVGVNTLPEGLELGEMVTNGPVTDFGTSDSFYTVVEVSQIENTGESATLSYQWASGSHDETPLRNGIPSGVIPLVVGVGTQPLNYPSPETLIRIYDLAGLSESIVNIYLIPRDLVEGSNNITITASQGGSSLSTTVAVPTSTFHQTTIGTTTFSRPNTVGGYVPKNAKLLTYPYQYFNISNNAGSSVPYHYEDFTNNSTIQFKTEGCFGLSGNVKTIPLNYKRLSTSENAMDYSVSGAKYPVASWKSDSYTNWLTQNAVNMQIQWRSTMISAGVDVFGGLLVGGAGGLVAGTIGGGKELIATAREQHIAKTRANLVPDQVNGNVNAGDFVWAKVRSKFTFIPMSIKAEYARCIDEYFSQFGYKSNRVKTPNLTGRRNWNYVKTVGCYIEADIPQEDLAEIKGMFDRGITIWHNPIFFGNYGADNDII